VWENRFKVRSDNDCLVSVDGTDFRIYEPKPRTKDYYSHKFNGPGLRYEVGLCILTGDIVWVNGPFQPGIYSDLSIFRLHMKWALEPGERIEADLGYPDEKVKTHALANDPRKVGMRKNVAARHETVNKRFKMWNILKNEFHHNVNRMAKHCAVFHSIAVITQLSFENGEPLFTVDYDDIEN
jgi:DDE superfamily endonuclease